MKELIRSNNPVFISWLQSRLGDDRIACVVLDAHTSIVDGSIGAIPRRIMVDDEDFYRAKRILDENKDLLPGN